MTEPFPIACYRDEITQIVQSVFDTMLGLAVEPIVSDCAAAAGSLTAAVYYAGNWRGALLVECSMDQGAEWALRLMPLEPPLAPDDVWDALGELANVIAGNLKSILPRGVGLSIPSVVQGSDYSVRICGGNLFERLTFTGSDTKPFQITFVEVLGDR
jgi:chemotaxis protein CheX